MGYHKRIKFAQDAPQEFGFHYIVVTVCYTKIVIIIPREAVLHSLSLSLSLSLFLSHTLSEYLELTREKNVDYKGDCNTNHNQSTEISKTTKKSP